MCDQQSLRSACAYAQSDQSLCLSLEYSMVVKLLTEHHLEFLSLKGGSRGSSESTHVKTPHCWKSLALAQLIKLINQLSYPQQDDCRTRQVTKSYITKQVPNINTHTHTHTHTLGATETSKSSTQPPP